MTVQGIHIIATTPTHIAVQLKTNAINITLTNCNRNCDTKSNAGKSRSSKVQEEGCDHHNTKRPNLRVHLDASLVLGILLKDIVADEEYDIQHLASFDTQAALWHGEPVSSYSILILGPERYTITTCNALEIALFDLTNMTHVLRGTNLLY